MKKPFLLFRGPVKSISGYGLHSRDLLKSLYDMDLFEIKIDSCPWGVTPLNGLNKENKFHTWIEENITSTLSTIPDIYVQVTVPNEFMTLGKFNIGVTAGIETNTAPKDWVEGCNKMDLIITTSNFSKEVLLSTLYNEFDKRTNSLINTHKIIKPIEVLFEGIDTDIFKKIEEPKKSRISTFVDSIESDFGFLFVGHWLKGKVGQDRKDIGMLIRCFAQTFSNTPNQPALILKTSSATFSVSNREILKSRIKDLTKEFTNPPPIYLLFGELTDEEMNELYNQKKIKSMVSITKGEGFGRPLLEFSMTGKPIIASNWSGHKDFLPMDKCILIGGELKEVDDSVIDKYIIKGSKWFTADYENFMSAMKVMIESYDNISLRSESLRIENIENYSLNKMRITFQSIIRKYTDITKNQKLVLPELIKVS